MIVWHMPEHITDEGMDFVSKQAEAVEGGMVIIPPGGAVHVTGVSGTSVLPPPTAFRKMLEGMTQEEREDVRNALNYLTQIVNKGAPVTRG